MNTIEFLKRQHLSMFDEASISHSNTVASLYNEYIADKDVEKENPWSLFSGFYLYFSEHFEAEIYEKEYIVGTNWHWFWQSVCEAPIKPVNIGHFIADFQDILTKGIGGKIKDVSNHENSLYLQTALNALSSYINHYAIVARTACLASQGEEQARLLQIANDCAYISKYPPAHFRQALQFIWFVQSFLNMESGNAAISFGTADSYLYPYYQKDIEEGVLTPDEALKLIQCFYIKISEGDESCMLTVGGNANNALTLLFMEAQTQLKMRQPSIALRVSTTTSTEILEKATDLVLSGSGMPAYFNDDIVIKGLQTLGFHEDVATNYAIVGCYEASPQGLFSNTVASAFNLYESFNAFLEQSSTYANFDEFLHAYKTYFDCYYKDTLVPIYKDVANIDRNRVCPFASCVLHREKYLFGINILGIGILIDSIYTIKKLVFEEKYTTLAYLRMQANKDFEDIDLYNKIIGLDSYYGSNSEESNRLAKDISEFIGKVIQNHAVDDNVIVSPALFWFTADIWQRNCDGMVNGRKKGELLSYGIMPCATPHENSLTSMLLSCANVSAQYFPNGCPAMVSLQKSDIKKRGILSALIKTFFEAGGFHIAVNTVDAELLEKARTHPKEHADVLVKISGYSARFTTLNEHIQDAVIERANQEK